jgi:chitosanase
MFCVTFNFARLIAVIVALLLLGSLPAISFAQSSGSSRQSSTGCAVVELFTSEGCSSCPPADALLAEMVANARKSASPVFPLAFHVDYWNRLGWADRFSDAAYSRRQSDYARARKTDDIYTPQMIVNGTEQFVGSDRDAAKRAVEAALAKPAPATVTMNVSSNSDGSYRVGYAVVGAGQRTVLNITVVERGLKTDVGAGENGGKVLRHENVVRWFRNANISADGKDQIEVPHLDDVNFANASIVIYAQEPENGPVLGAASVDFPEPVKTLSPAVGLRDPAKKEIAMQLISSAENSSLDWKAQYGYIEYNVEGNEKENRGYTAGIIGFTSKTHDMLELVEYYDKIAPGNALTAYLPALRKVDGTASQTGLGKAFEHDWKAAGTDPKFRQAQDHERDRTYFNPAVDQAQRDGLHTLGQFIYYDAIVMHGDGDDPTSFRGIRSAAIKKAKPPAQGGDETIYLNAFLDARKAAMLTEQGHTDTTRVNTMQRVFLRAGNLNLNPPLSFKVYGDDFKIADAQQK